jgi:FSR family fosmidomycin resistance protein-like MFS transporter
MAIKTRANAVSPSARQTAVAVLAAISICHLLNDVIQSLIVALYPMIKDSLALDFRQIGLITFTFTFTASVLQPLVGFVTDRYPTPYSLVVGMGCSLLGLLIAAFASTYGLVLAAVGLIGMGSSVFHPESSRVARLASGGQHGLAQSVFQVGGNFGTALGPLLAAFVVLPFGQQSIAWFSIVALIGMIMLAAIGSWYGRTLRFTDGAHPSEREAIHELTHGKVRKSVAILMALTFSKDFYLVSITSFYTFYLIHTFALSVRSAQLYLFLFLFAVAAGTVIGGPIGDRIGTRRVIWWSILGVLPFTLALPYVGLLGTAILSVIIGLILASAHPAIIVYAQSLIPGRVGMVAGLFFGLAFGVAGIGAAFLGWLADVTSITFVYHVCAFLPAIGLLAAFLPEMAKPRRGAARRKT